MKSNFAGKTGGQICCSSITLWTLSRNVWCTLGIWPLTSGCECLRQFVSFKSTRNQRRRTLCSLVCLHFRQLQSASQHIFTNSNRFRFLRQSKLCKFMTKLNFQTKFIVLGSCEINIFQQTMTSQTTLKSSTLQHTWTSETILLALLPVYSITSIEMQGNHSKIDS